jgi:hypothetical protein
MQWNRAVEVGHHREHHREILGAGRKRPAWSSDEAKATMP